MRETSFQETLKRWGRPERVVLAVTIDQNKKTNILTIGWKMRTSVDPPMVAISVGHKRHSHAIIRESKEFVLAVPGEDQSEAAMLCGTKSGKKYDKIMEAKLTPIPAKFIKPPLIAECIANLECKLVGELLTGDHTIFVGEVLNSWVSDDNRSNLLLIGSESGYKVTSEDFSYRFGTIKK
jgi:flavin reductase (DIM6/NTAB) family NADH-FMN oxidoreductase RutF